MRFTLFALQNKAALLVAAVVVTAIGRTREPAVVDQAPRGKPNAMAHYGKLPLHFEANEGQMDERVKFLARGRGYGLFLTASESVLVLREAEAVPSRPPAILRMKLVGANPHPAVEGRDALPGKSHYFIGNDPGKWRTNVPRYARVEYRDVYPGVSLTYYGNQGQLEYDFIVSPGADPGQIRVGIEGAEEISVDAQGNLSLSLPEGEIVQRRPVSYQEVDGARRTIDGRFVLVGAKEVGFEVGAYEADRPLVLDPVLTYSTYLGGRDVDEGFVIAVDASGNAYVAGSTGSSDFPTANAVQGVIGAGRDAFVAKINAAGSALVYSTYLGGDGTDYGLGIAVDTSGNAYVAGSTGSTDFPTVNAVQAANGGGMDAFVAKLNSAGSALVYSTYLGGSGADFGQAMAVDGSGNAYITGATGSLNFPTANPIQAAINGPGDAFVTKLNAAGSALVYSTYLGGSDGDQGQGIAVDTSGNAYVTGATFSTDFPTANAVQATKGGNPGDTDAFVAKLNAAGSALAYSTYLGGSGMDIGYGIAVDASGNACVTGMTLSSNFPTANPLQASGGSGDAFVAKLNPAGSALVYSTYLGGSGNDQGFGIASDASGNTYVTGITFSTNFPTASPLQAMNGGGSDAFVAKVNAAGWALMYSTYLGGSADDGGGGIAVDATGNAYVIGRTSSTNFPTANPLQPAIGGGYDAFVAKIGVEPNPASFFTVTPCRMVDTRNPVGPSGGPALAANTTRRFPVAGVCGIPSTASAVALIVTVVDETDFGDLRLYPAGSPPPSASTINFAVQKARASNAIIPLGAGGQIAVQCDMPPGSTGHTHFLFDVTGYFQ